jgi:hypothetical protein
MTRRHCAVKRLEASRASRDRTLDTLAHFAPSAINEHRVRRGRRSVRIQRSKELHSGAIQATACLPPPTCRVRRATRLRRLEIRGRQHRAGCIPASDAQPPHPRIGDAVRRLRRRGALRNDRFGDGIGVNTRVSSGAFAGAAGSGCRMRRARRAGEQGGSEGGVVLHQRHRQGHGDRVITVRARARRNGRRAGLTRSGGS